MSNVSFLGEFYISRERIFITGNNVKAISSERRVKLLIAAIIFNDNHKEGVMKHILTPSNISGEGRT